MRQRTRGWARCSWGGLTGALRKDHAIEVTFSMDTEGLLSVTAKDVASGKTEEVKVDARMDLGEKEAAALAAQEEKHRGAQPALDAVERRKNRHARRALHGALVNVRRVHLELQTMGGKDTAEARLLVEQLATAIVEAETAETSGTLEAVEAITAKLMQLIS